MENFNEMLIEVVQKKIMSDIMKQDLIKVDYADKVPLPKGFIQSVYQTLDIDRIKVKLVENLEDEMADKIANKMITEFSNGIKQIMTNKELREELRHYAREKIRQISDCVSE